MMNGYPKSYLTDAEREGMRSRGLSQNGIYLAESQAADHAGDDETSWAWLAHAELSPTSLMNLKRWNGAQFIRDRGFRTARADAAFGADWLNQDV